MEYLSKEMKKKFMEGAKDWSKEKDKALAKETCKAALVMKRLTAKEDKSKTHAANKEEIMVLLKTLRDDVIHNPITTVKGLYAKAKKANKLVTMEDVQEFWRGQEAGQIKDMKGYNSYVASLPRQQYHLDIAYITKAKSKAEMSEKGGFLPEEEGVKDGLNPDEEEEAPKKKKRGLKNIPDIWGKFPKAFIAVDAFSKKVSVTPVEGTTSEDSVKGMKKAMEDLGPPIEVYTDDGGEFKGAFATYLEGQNIKHIVTRRHAMFAERFTRYLRWHLRDRQKRFGGDWGVWASDIVKNYNKGTEEKPTHTTTKLSPDEGHKDENALDVKLNLVMQAKRDRNYPPLEEGDRVKIYQKKTRGEEKKEIVPVWSPDTFRVKEVTREGNHEYYELDPKPVGLKAKYLRHELLKVG